LYRSGKAAKQGDKKMTTRSKAKAIKYKLEAAAATLANTQNDRILNQFAQEIEHRTDLTLWQKLDTLTDLTNALYMVNKAKAGI
jgi:hypothetical protein